MTEDQIKHMVNRFLGWKLPANFSPDAGISFKAAYNEHTAWPSKHEPSGTNLFDFTQADAMIRYIVDGMPAAHPIVADGRAAQEPVAWICWYQGNCDATVLRSRVDDWIRLGRKVEPIYASSGSKNDTPVKPALMPWPILKAAIEDDDRAAVVEGWQPIETVAGAPMSRARNAFDEPSDIEPFADLALPSHDGGKE